METETEIKCKHVEIKSTLIEEQQQEGNSKGQRCTKTCHSRTEREF